MKFLFVFYTTLLLSFGLYMGCKGTLDPAGVYKGDSALYASDETLKTTVDGIDAFLKWELANRATLKVTDPKVTPFADDLRTKVPQWVGSIKALRTAYLANPTPESAASVQNIVNLLNAALAQAVIYLTPQPVIQPLPAKV